MTQNKSEDSQNKATLPNDSTPETEKAKAKPSAKRPNKQGEPSASQAKTATRIAVVAIVLSLATTAGLYWHGHQFREHTNTQLQLLNTSLDAKEQNLMALQNNSQPMLTRIISGRSRISGLILAARFMQRLLLWRCWKAS